MGRFYASLGGFCVRFRWLVAAAWLLGTFAAIVTLPSIGSVTQTDNSTFLPASAPSQQAAALAAPLQAASLTSVTVVVARPGGPSHGTLTAAGALTEAGALTAADQAAIAGLAGDLSRVAHVVSVRDAGESADGKAEQLTVLAAIAQSGGPAAAQEASLVSGLRDVIRLGRADDSPLAACSRWSDRTAPARRTSGRSWSSASASRWAS